MKKVLFVHHVAAIGGGSYCMLNILKNVRFQSVMPLVLLGQDGPLKKEIENLGIKVFVDGNITSAPYNKALWRRSCLQSYLHIGSSQKAFAAFLDAHPVDAVYLNNSMLYPLLKVAKAKGCKTLIHIREHWPMDEHRLQLGWLQSGIRRYADEVLAINRYSASMVPGIAVKTTIVYDWIDFSDRYEEMPLERIFNEDCSNLKVLLFTGGFIPIKGAYEVISSFKECIKSPDYRLLVLGTPARETGDKRMWNLVDSDPRIKCLPSVYKLKHLVQQSYCMLSYFTIPHANLAQAESIVLQTPVICAATDESEEYSDGGRLSCLFPINDIEAFRKALTNIESIVPKLQMELSHGSSVTEELFFKENNVKKLQNLFDQL